MVLWRGVVFFSSSTMFFFGHPDKLRKSHGRNSALAGGLLVSRGETKNRAPIKPKPLKKGARNGAAVWPALRGHPIQPGNPSMLQTAQGSQGHQARITADDTFLGKQEPAGTRASFVFFAFFWRPDEAPRVAENLKTPACFVGRFQGGLSAGRKPA